MEAHPVQPSSSAEAQWLAWQSKWASGWRRLIWPGVFLTYLLFVAGAVSDNVDGVATVVGWAILFVFAAWYLFLVWKGKDLSLAGQWAGVGVMFALFLAALPFAHGGAFVMCLYITTSLVAMLGARSTPFVIAMALGALLLPAAIPAWDEDVGDALAQVTPVAIPIVALVTVAVMRILEGNNALADARAEELARLTAENERSRIARDLHDLLGHSLTTITVKAGLAARLRGVDDKRAFVEIGEVEALARRTLAEVRAAVAGYRDATLAGELATGRELLRAADVEADLPRAVDAVDLEHQELFGWIVREGLTNVVRHAHARQCAVTLGAGWVEIVDDGDGGNGCGRAFELGGRRRDRNGYDEHTPMIPVGTGLTGLRERVGAAGGSLEAGPLEPSGWRLRVTLPGAGNER